MFTISDIIDLAIRIEQNGEKIYRKAMSEVSDPLLSAMLERLANDELEHEKWFDALKQRISPSGIDAALEEMGRTMLRGVLGDQVFSLAETDFSKIENVKALLEQSIEFETDTILFFEMIGAFVEGEDAKKGINEIIEEENRHVRLLTDWIEKGVFPPVD